MKDDVRAFDEVNLEPAGVEKKGSNRLTVLTVRSRSRVESFWATVADHAPQLSSPQKGMTVPVPVPTGNRLPDYRD